MQLRKPNPSQPHPKFDVPNPGDPLQKFVADNQETRYGNPPKHTLGNPRKHVAGTLWIPIKNATSSVFLQFPLLFWKPEQIAGLPAPFLNVTTMYVCGR